MSVDTRTATYYRDRRRDGWLATNAMQWARAESALIEAEMAGRIIVRVVADDDFNPRDSSDIDEIIDDEIDGLTTGRYEVYGVRVYVPNTCAHCGHDIATPADEIDRYENDPEACGWRESGSLWGVVVGHPFERDPYIRDIAHDLASEAGVI